MTMLKRKPSKTPRYVGEVFDTKKQIREKWSLARFVSFAFETKGLTRSCRSWIDSVYAAMKADGDRIEVEKKRKAAAACAFKVRKTTEQQTLSDMVCMLTTASHLLTFLILNGVVFNREVEEVHFGDRGGVLSHLYAVVFFTKTTGHFYGL
jgi:hypothetical protein